MEKSRLIIVFNSLNKRELRQLSKFVRSPFFNQQKELVTFFDYLVECRQYLKIIPTKKQVFTRLYPAAQYKDTKVRLLMSDLFKLIEHYLVYEDFFEEDVKSQIRLVSAYRKRNLTKLFDRTIRKVEEELKKGTSRNAEYYNESYLLQLEKYQFASISKRTEELNLQEISDTVDVAYLALKLRHTCFLLSHQRVYNTEYRFGLLADVIAYIEEQNYLEIPAIAVYYYCYHSLTRAEEVDYFYKFKQQIVDYSSLFPKGEMRDLYLLAINFCIKKINEGNEDFANEVLDLYKEGLKQEIFLINGILSRFTYRNIVAIGLKMGNYDWVESFIHTYKLNLEKKYQEGVFSYALGHLEYERKNFKDALTLLKRVEHSDLLITLVAKTLLLKIYYELDELDKLESHLDSMKTFLRRKKVIGYHQANYLNIINFTKKLISVNPYDKAEKEALKLKIEAEALIEKDWLLAQLKSL